MRVFEMSNDVGGVWQYSEAAEDDPMGAPVEKRVHSSMYASLRTNLPREVMAYDDLPFTDEFDDRRFVHHSAVHKYLKKYTDTYDLRGLISFGRKVTKLEPLLNAKEGEGYQGTGWELEHEAAGSGGGGERERFDVVMVCNGHYSEPWSPALEGASLWPGTTSHSHNYRTAAAFAGKRVLVVGASASGEDISREVATAASQVYLSARSWQNPDWGAPDAPPFGPQQNILRKTPIRRLLANGGVEFVDGSRLDEVDHLLFCTGYRYRFPFLEHANVVRVDDNAVLPLYKHMLPPDVPSIAFIGLPSKVHHTLAPTRARIHCPRAHPSLYLYLPPSRMHTHARANTHTTLREMCEHTGDTVPAVRGAKSVRVAGVGGQHSVASAGCDAPVCKGRARAKAPRRCAAEVLPRAGGRHVRIQRRAELSQRRRQDARVARSDAQPVLPKQAHLSRRVPRHRLAHS